MTVPQMLNPAQQLQAALEEPDSTAFLKAMTLAEQAFELLHRYRMPPIPRAYELCYAYVAGQPKEVRPRMDSAVSDDGILSLYSVFEIHDDLLSYPEAVRRNQDDTANDLSVQLSSVLEQVGSHMQSNESYSESLDKASDELNGNVTAAKLRKTIDWLVAENARARDESRALSENLEASQTAIQSMRNKLEEAREAGLSDALTSLRNRRFFDAALPKEIARARADGTPLALAMVDIDHFKRINDTHGHPAGDAVLRIVGTLLAANVKGRDTPTRYGGEEFAIILPQTSLGGAVELSDKIRKELSSKNLVLTHTKSKIGRVTASFGVAELRADDQPADLIERADKMLYAAKNNGRNRVEGA